MKAQEIRLVNAILALAEKQYRKGYQHGVEAALNCETNSDKAARFRADGSKCKYRKRKDPLTGRITPPREAASLLWMESPFGDELQDLLIQYCHMEGQGRTAEQLVAIGEMYEPSE